MNKAFVFIALALTGFGTFAQNSPGNRMSLCASQAAGKSGDERSAFMRACLTAGQDSARDVNAVNPATVDQPTAYVVEFDVDNVNSAGGVEVFARFSNPNTTTAIKYIRMNVSAYNAVGDQVGSDIYGGRTKRLSYTGPLRQEDGVVRADWGPIWYNSTVRCVKVQSVSIDFMNGKSQTFSGGALAKALSNSMSNTCKAQ